jgi:hypothetical protein
LVTFDKTVNANPILPKLIELLAESGRKTELTSRELVQICQIQNHIEEQVAISNYPEKFSTVIPANVKQAAVQEYKDFELKKSYSNEQKEIAKILLKLRVTFSEKTPVKLDNTTTYVDFKLSDPV